jgi:hypothetical protein
MNPDELLLRDIHLPDPVSWWPPAIGWWLLVALGIASAVVLVHWIQDRARRRRSPAAIAARDLDRLRVAWHEHGDAGRLLRELSTWLRRVGMSLTSRQSAAGLTGERWMRFLDELAGDDVLADQAGLLVEGPYRNDESFARDEIESLLSRCEEWLAAVRRAERRP